VPGRPGRAASIHGPDVEPRPIEQRQVDLPGHQSDIGWPIVAIHSLGRLKTPGVLAATERCQDKAQKQNTMAALGYPVPWDRAHFIAVLQAAAAGGEKVWGDAYNISNGGKSIPKVEVVAGVLDALWARRKQLRPPGGQLTFASVVGARVAASGAIWPRQSGSSLLEDPAPDRFHNTGLKRGLPQRSDEARPRRRKFRNRRLETATTCTCA
jgi:hypothetical protein